MHEGADTMNKKVLATLLALLCIPHAALSQGQDFYDAAFAMSRSALIRLTNPRNSPFAIGIVSLDVGMRISSVDAPPSVEYLEGQDGSLIANTMLQLQDAATDHVSFRIVHTTVTAQDCPDLSDAIANFYSELKSFLSAPYSIDSAPPDIELGRFYTDSTDTLVQVQLADASVTIRLPQSTRPMQQSVYRVVSVGRRCSEGGEESRVEEHK